MARKRCWQNDWVLDLDIKGFFDNLDHELTMRAVRTHTEERWVLLYIERWLKAPIVRQDGTRQVPEKGTPQGGVASPLLANLFLHYAFDKWMEREYPGIVFEHEQLWRMLRRRHPNRSRNWLFRKYWTYEDGRTIFSFNAKTKSGPRRYQVVRLGSIGIRRHRKIRAHANPYTREDAAYFAQRRRDKEKRLLPGLTSRESRVLLAT